MIFDTITHKVTVYCDQCRLGRTDSSYSKAAAVKKIREDGWSVGKTNHWCPKHRTPKQREAENVER